MGVLRAVLVGVEVLDGVVVGVSVGVGVPVGVVPAGLTSPVLASAPSSCSPGLLLRLMSHKLSGSSRATLPL